MKFLNLFAAAMLVFLSVDLGSAQASSFWSSLDYSRVCEKRFYDWTAASENEEDDDAMLIKAKIPYRAKRFDKAIKYASEAINANTNEAKTIQDSLIEYPWESKAIIFKYKALNTVGLALLIKGKSYSALGKAADAEAAYAEIKNKYNFAQCWCKQGVFVKPSEFPEETITKKEKK